MTHADLNKLGWAYLVLVLLYVGFALWNLRRIFTELKKSIPREVWRELDLPESIWALSGGADQNWRRMIRTKSYRQYCSECASRRVEAAQSYGRRVSLFLFLLGLVVTILFIRFDPR